MSAPGPTPQYHSPPVPRNESRANNAIVYVCALSEYSEAHLEKIKEQPWRKIIHKPLIVALAARRASRPLSLIQRVLVALFGRI